MPETTISSKLNISINPTDFIRPNRKSKIQVGFGDEYLDIFSGRSEYPSVKTLNQRANFHFFDEVNYLSEFKLTGGDLQINVRTDRYIWGILDYVYGDYFTKIASFDSDETWSNSTAETNNHRGGDGSIKIEATAGGTTNSDMTLSSLDLSSYSDDDFIDFFLFIESITKFDSITIFMGDSTLTNYFSKTWGIDDLEDEWNQIHINKSEFEATGSPDWSDIDKVRISITAETGQDVYVIIDELRVVKLGSYPQRFFDTGIQIIPTAWWAGNTALYEIKIACESEGARFYCDEMGILRFENRQHYNNNLEHKVSVHQFQFDNMIDFEYIGRKEDIINKIIIKLKPRQIQDEQEIWRYAFTPKQISGSQTIEIWAEFNNPVPTTTEGLVTPVATTDYTANSNSDGSGSDRTSDLSISITKFSTSAKITIENTSGTALYLTLLKLRGTPAIESDEVRVIVEDSNSIAEYGVSPDAGYEISNKYMADEAYAQTLGEQLLEWYKNPIRRVVLKNRSIPHLQIGDMVTVTNEINDINYLMRITSIKNQFSNDGLNQEITCRSVSSFELLSFFTVGTSEIEGTDVIAP